MQEHTLRGTASAVPNRDSFTTDSLPLAAFLACQGHTADLQVSDRGRALFVVPLSPELDADLRAYQDGSARVPPGAYEAARLQLLNRIKALRGGGR